MGKKIRNYSICVLFILMSMSVFAAAGGIKGAPTASETVVKLVDVDESNYPEITLIFDGDGTVTSLKENKKNSTDYITYFFTKEIDNQNKITYKSTLPYKKNDWVDITFSIEGKEYNESYKQPQNYDSSDTTTEEETVVGEAEEETVAAATATATNDQTTIIVSGIIENGGVTYLNHQGGGNKIENFLYDFSEDGSEVVITFTGNNAKSVIVEESGSIKDGSLVKNNDTYTYVSSTTNTDGEVTLTFSVSNGGGSGGGATDYIYIKYTIPYSPKDIEGIVTYEELNEESEVESDGYKFTKGGAGSYITTPAIYVLIPGDEDDDEDGEKITKLKIETLVDGEFEEQNTVSIGEEKEVEVTSNFAEGSNTVRVTPINEYGMEGTSSEFNFVVDTRVNDTYLEGGIIGELDDDGKIVIDLSDLEELSGVDGYSYTFTVGEEEKSDSENGINDYSFTTLQSDSTDEVIKIDTSGLKEGSKGTLLFTVYDKLGHEKTFEKTYFIPAKPSGVTAMIEGEVKERNSKIKIVTEGNKDKFGIESNSDGSSEDE